MIVTVNNTIITYGHCIALELYTIKMLYVYGELVILIFVIHTLFGSKTAFFA